MNKDIKLSNIKGLLILLVIFGHLIEPYQKNFNELFLFIYSFHMPLFILISGYFAKKASYKKVVNLLLLYTIFQVLYRSFLTVLNPDEVFQLRYQVPYYHLWYLVSMAGWCLFAIWYKKSPLQDINKIVLGVGCFIIGFASKFFTEPVVDLMKNINSDFYSYTFSYQRTLSFLPFFFLGLLMSQKHMKRLYHSLKWKKLFSAAAMSVTYIYFGVIKNTNEEKILKGSFGIDQMEGRWFGTTVQILVGYMVAITLCYVLLNLVSDKKNFLTKWGDRSLPIFLFHVFFTLIIKELPILNEVNQGVLLPLLFVIAVLIAQLLSSDLFIKCTYYLWNPYEVFAMVMEKIKSKFNHEQMD